MSLPPWKLLGGLVLAAPFVLFLILLANSPAVAGIFAGSLLGRLTDPAVLLGIVLGVVAGKAGFRWFWAFGVGIVQGAIGAFLGYSWWVKVAGDAVANLTAERFMLWTIFLTLYDFIAGSMFSSTPKNAP